MRITWERRRLDAIIQIFVYAGLPAAPVCGNRSLWNQINYLCQFPQEPAKHTAHHKFVQKIGCPLWPRRSTVFSVCVCNCERVCVVERGFSWHLWFLTARAQVCVFLFPHTHRCSEDSWVSTRQAIVSASSQIIRELCCRVWPLHWVWSDRHLLPSSEILLFLLLFFLFCWFSPNKCVMKYK